MTSQRPYWCPKTILWELNSFLMQTLPFVPINLHRCWPREWKHSIDSHECLQENIKMIQIYSPMRKYGQLYFWKFLTTSLSGRLLFHWKIADRLRFMKTKEIQAARMILWTILKIWTCLLSLTNLLKMYHASTLIAKRARNLMVYPCLLTNRRGDIINGWWLVDDW